MTLATRSTSPTCPPRTNPPAGSYSTRLSAVPKLPAGGSRPLPAGCFEPPPTFAQPCMPGSFDPAYPRGFHLPTSDSTHVRAGLPPFSDSPLPPYCPSRPTRLDASLQRERLCPPVGDDSAVRTAGPRGSRMKPFALPSPWTHHISRPRNWLSAGAEHRPAGLGREARVVWHAGSVGGHPSRDSS